MLIQAVYNSLYSIKAKEESLVHIGGVISVVGDTSFYAKMDLAKFEVLY